MRLCQYARHGPTSSGVSIASGPPGSLKSLSASDFADIGIVEFGSPEFSHNFSFDRKAVSPVLDLGLTLVKSCCAAGTCLGHRETMLT